MYNKDTQKQRLRPWSLSGGVKRRSNLRRALIVYILLPMGLFTAVGAWWSLQAFERQVESRMQKDLEMVARAIKRPLSHALLREREGSIAEALKSAFEMSHVYGAYLYDNDGRRITDTVGHDQEGGDEDVGARMAEGERHGKYGEMGGRHVYSYFVPLTDSGGRITGLLQLTRRRSDIEQHIRMIRYRAAGLFLIAFLVLTAVVLYGHHRVFGKHLNRLSSSMARIADGELKHRHAPGGSRELAALGDHFNAMLDNISRAEKEIERRRDKQMSLEEELRQKEKLAAIGELAAGIAHELGTPLSLMDAETQRLLRGSEKPKALQRTIEVIRREIGRMERIIRQLLDFSSRHDVILRRVGAAEMVRSSVASVAHEAESNGTGIVLDELDQAVLHVDPIRIEQALVNLLRNGIQAAAGGEVRIGCSRNQEKVIFVVEDNGVGIDERHLTKIFDPFFTTKRVGDGTGLGLAVVHGIAEEHNGRVEVESGRQTGARFRFVLPLQPSTTA